uniref:TorF family putative porin n=1 Tax=Polynucleobacter sp. TaxID=2029855 RepID=UPI0040476C56
MKTYLTLSAIALAAAATLSSGTVLAQAPAPAPDFTVTGTFGITSDYRFRGISQNDLDPAFQGGFDVAHSSGLYFGTWGSNVSTWTAGTGSFEMDLYGGYKTTAGNLGVDVGVIAYKYPGTTASGRSETEEMYLGLSYGPAVFKTYYVLGKDYFASGGTDNSGTMYYDLSLSYEIMPKLIGSVHVGYTDYKKDSELVGKFSYADYNVGLAYDLGNGFTAAAKYFFNDAKSGTEAYAGTACASGCGTGKDLLKDGFAVSLTKAF